MAKGLGFKVGTKTVRFDDLTPAAWMRVDAGSSLDWSDVYLAPLRNLTAGILVLEECVKVAEPDAEPVARAGELAPTLRALSELVIEVEDDMPTEVRDGVPTVGVDG